MPVAPGTRSPGFQHDPLDRRLAELERELRDVEKSIRVMERGDPAPAVPRAPAPARARRAPPPPRAVREPGGGDLFAYARQRGEAGREGAGPPRQDKERFASYFTSGNFIRSRPLRQERRLQRNKALFMLFVVAMVAFVVVSLLRR